jgi:hypothetical protein
MQATTSAHAAHLSGAAPTLPGETPKLIGFGAPCVGDEGAIVSISCFEGDGSDCNFADCASGPRTFV